MEEFETLREQFIARGEQLVSDLIGNEVNFSDPPEDLSSEEAVDEFGQSADNAIAAAIASFTGEQVNSPNTSASEATELPETAEPSIATQETLIGTGIEEVFANLGSESPTNAIEGSSGSDFQFKFEPISGDTFGGQVSLFVGEDATPLFSIGVGGTSSATNGDNPFSGSNSEDLFASFAGGENPFAGGSILSA